MAKEKDRVLFSHELDGILKQLFFVVKKKDESLVVVVRNEDRLGVICELMDFENKQLDFKAITTTRISIHNSDASQGLLLKQTVELLSGGKETNACFISNAKNRLLRPLFYKVYPGLSNPRYNISKKYKEVIRLGCSSTSDKASLCIAVFLSDNQDELPKIPWATLTTYTFKKYTLAIYHCFVNITPDRDGVSLFPMTEKDGRGDGGVESIFTKDIKDDIEGNFYQMVFCLMKMKRDLVDAEIFAKLMSHKIYFHRDVYSLFHQRLYCNEFIV
jgi:hypothetical protein